MLRALLASLLAVLALAASPRAVSAMPGPRPVCDAEGRGCTSCWQHYGASPDEAAQFKACADPLAAKGLVEACRNRQGAGDAVYFCPAGVKVETKIVGGGCAGCANGAGAAPEALAAIAVGAAIAASRRRSRRRGSPSGRSPG